VVDSCVLYVAQLLLLPSWYIVPLDEASERRSVVVVDSPPLSVLSWECRELPFEDVLPAVVDRLPASEPVLPG
jgi:hypothetical protein